MARIGEALAAPRRRDAAPHLRLRRHRLRRYRDAPLIDAGVPFASIKTERYGGDPARQGSPGWVAADV